MSFLSKFGKIASTVTQVAIQVAGFEPIAERFLPNSAGILRTVSKDLNEVASIVQQIEVVGEALKLDGTQKLTAASPLVAQVIMQSAILAKHKINDPEKFKAGVNKIASGMADVLNSLEEKVEVIDKA